MKHRTKNILRGIAKHLGLKVVFVSYLEDDVHGKLLPREKRILINAHKPRTEHVYTLLHEIGHYLMHFKSLPRKRHPRFFDIYWKAEWLATLCSKLRRYYRFIFNKKSGKEWEADLWAMCALVYLKKFIGRAYLTAFLNRHPEKMSIYLLAVTGAVYCEIKKRIAAAFKLLRNLKHALSGQSS